MTSRSKKTETLSLLRLYTMPISIAGPAFAATATRYFLLSYHKFCYHVPQPWPTIIWGLRVNSIALPVSLYRWTRALRQFACNVIRNSVFTKSSFVEPRPSAHNMTLPAFAAERGLQAYQESTDSSSSKASKQLLLLSIAGTDRQTWTPTVRLCYAYHAGGVNKANLQKQGWIGHC